MARPTANLTDGAAENPSEELQFAGETPRPNTANMTALAKANSRNLARDFVILAVGLPNSSGKRLVKRSVRYYF